MKGTQKAQVCGCLFDDSFAAAVEEIRSRYGSFSAYLGRKMPEREDAGIKFIKPDEFKSRRR